MAALVQTIPQQTGTITMLQTRPASASGSYQPSPPAQSYQNNPRQMPRNLYNHGGISVGSSGYRGTTVSPVAPYAFTATPGLGGSNQARPSQSTPHLRQENRTLSAPSIPYSQQNIPKDPFPTASLSSTSTNPQFQPTRSQDDSHTNRQLTSFDPNIRPISMIDLSAPSFPPSSGTKATPDRYRRGHRRPETNLPAANQRVTSPSGSAMPSGSGMATVGHLYNPAQMGRSTSADDMALYRQPSSDRDRASRRRSIGNFNFTASTLSGPWDPATAQHNLLPDPPQAVARPDIFTRTATSPVLRPTTHNRTASTESTSSSRSSSKPPSIKRDNALSVTTANVPSPQSQAAPKNEIRPANVPPRGSSDANKRMQNPSPLSQPMTLSPTSPTNNQADNSLPTIQVNHDAASPAHGIADSPAAQHLASLNDKDGKKGKKSRLRRAFSFGSAAELRRASGGPTPSKETPIERARLRKERHPDEDDVEQAAIAQKQEEAGLGESIYSKGQGRFFSGSTDNLSISSTASSASIMIRKMGKGMKKSTRSLVGLFRPKSVVGVPAADSPIPEPTLAQVSMVTVEAEREKVNINANPHEQVGGGTGFPKLERNSIDAGNVAAAAYRTSISSAVDSGSSQHSRRSIVGGEKERADVLAAVKKGILKRAGTDSNNSSPVVKPIDIKTMDFNLPVIPRISDSPSSSVSSTPSHEHPPRSGHRRTDSVTIEGEDYFLSMPKLHGDSKSAPNTPHGTIKNIHFSPRIQFHDTWPSQEYDRRGDIATCNRLTPMLAQQIKEELNSFKMEMEVHESSKVYTHFF